MTIVIDNVLKSYSLTHWVYASLNQAIIGSDNGLSPDWRQAII